MSYWILAVLVASGIVVFEGTVAWWIVPLFILVVAWKRGARELEKSSRCRAMCSGRAAFIFVCT